MIICWVLTLKLNYQGTIIKTLCYNKKMHMLFGGFSVVVTERLSQAKQQKSMRSLSMEVFNGKVKL